MTLQPKQLLAEKHYYSIVELYEELQATVLDKLGLSDKASQDTSVFDKVRTNYQAKAAAEIKKYVLRMKSLTV